MSELGSKRRAPDQQGTGAPRSVLNPFLVPASGHDPNGYVWWVNDAGLWRARGGGGS
jgi:hypothetical protein